MQINLLQYASEIPVYLAKRLYNVFIYLTKKFKPQIKKLDRKEKLKQQQNDDYYKEKESKSIFGR